MRAFGGVFMAKPGVWSGVYRKIGKRRFENTACYIYRYRLLPIVRPRNESCKHLSLRRIDTHSYYTIMHGRAQ